MIVLGLSLRRSIVSFACMLFGLTAFSHGEIYGQDENPTPTHIDSLYTPHPRLLLHDSEIPAIKSRIESDAFARAEFASLHADAEALLRTAPSRYDKHKVESSLLWTAREIESRVLTLAGVYRLTGDRRFADRAMEEMLSASRFPDWNPSHFLDTAELTTALGIGYDWLYPVMPEAARETIKAAILHLGIQPFTGLLDQRRIHYQNNWIQVLYGGETIGALAIAERNDPASIARAEQVIGYARPEIATIMKRFVPDGGFEEGPAYWAYATAYNVLYIDALDSALGTDFGASSTPGFAETPAYRIQSLGPSMHFANFGDSHPDTFPAPQMYWFARRFQRSDYSLEEQGISAMMRSAHLSDALKPTLRFKFLGLLWYASGSRPSEEQVPEKMKHFTRIDHVYMRTAWNDREAWYAAFRGGVANLSHSHLDLGSFILDAFGETWAIDMGPDSYELPEYFGTKRWDYYRLQSLSHNTLTVKGQSESPTSKATISRYGRLDRSSFAVMNLGETYANAFSSWSRGLMLKDAGSVVLQDEYKARSDVDVVWHVHTKASVSLSADGRTAQLSQNGKMLYATMLSPSDGRFTTEACVGGPGESDNTGVTDLAIHRSQRAGNGQFVVTFSREKMLHSGAPPALDAWK